MLYRMRRSCLIPPSTEETSDPFEHVNYLHSLKVWILFGIIGRNSGYAHVLFSLQLVATIIHQSHLCPLPLTVQPIIWNYDHGLHLYPTPHTVLSSFFYMEIF